MRPKNSKISQSLFGVLIFSNHLNNPFQFDSIAYISNNAKLQNPDKLLTIEFWQKEFHAHGLLRVTVALNAYPDGFKPFGYHIVNLVFHILNSLLLFFVLEKSFRRFGFNAIGWADKRIRVVSFFGAILFLCHPI